MEIQITKNITDTVKSWQDEDSRHGNLNVDNGNLSTFIKELVETVVSTINKEEATKFDGNLFKEMEMLKAQNKEYQELKELFIVSEKERERINKALINVACLIK